jgi:hypothetical protein
MMRVVFVFFFCVVIGERVAGGHARDILGLGLGNLPFYVWDGFKLFLFGATVADG